MDITFDDKLTSDNHLLFGEIFIDNDFINNAGIYETRV